MFIRQRDVNLRYNYGFKRFCASHIIALYEYQCIDHLIISRRTIYSFYLASSGVYIYAYDLQNSCSAQAFVKRQTSEAYTYIVFSKII